MAIERVEFLLSDKGIAAIEATGQSAIRPAVASDKNKLPDALKKYVKQTEYYYYACFRRGMVGMVVKRFQIRR
jgi:hypothetical protein